MCRPLLWLTLALLAGCRSTPVQPFATTAEELAADPVVRKQYLGEKFTLERYR